MEPIIQDQALYNKVFENSKEGIFGLNKDGEITAVNVSACKIFDQPVDAIVGQSIHDFFSDFDVTDDSQRIIKSTLCDGSKVSIKVRILSNDVGSFPEIIFMTNISSVDDQTIHLSNKTSQNNALVRVLPDNLFILDGNGTYLEVHTKSLDSLYVSEDKLIGKTIFELLPVKLCERIMKAFAISKSSGDIQILEYSLDFGEETKYFEARIVRKEFDQYLAIVRNISNAKKKEIHAGKLSVALEMILTNANIGDVTKQIAHSIEDYLSGCKVSVLRLDQDSQKLYTLAAPNLPKTFNEKINGLKIGLNVGSCGTAAFLKEEVRVNNISTDPRWEGYQQLAADQGLKACWSFPIFSMDAQVLGTFAIYTSEKRMLTSSEKEVLDDANKLLSIAIEHQKTQDSLSESNRKYSTLINNLPGVVYWCQNDTDWTMEYLNNNIETLTGYEPEKFIGNSKLSFNSIIHSEDQERVRKEVQKAVNKGKSFEISYRIITADNKLKWVWEQGAEIYNADKDSYSLEGYIIDVTQQKKAEEVLKQNENRLRDYAANLESEVKQRTSEVLATIEKMEQVNISLENQILETKIANSKAIQNQELFSAIAKNFPKGIIVVISKELDIVYCEGEALKDFELDDELIVGATLDDITFMDEQAKSVLKERIVSTLNGEHQSFEVDYYDQFFAVNTTPLYDSNKMVTRALFVYNDITMQKQVEMNIQKSLTQQQELNELKSRFVSMASHEFRTPLTAIMSSAILLGKNNIDEFADRKERYISQINTNVQHLVSLLEDFLTISKLEEGKINVNPEDVDLVAFAEAIMDELTDKNHTGHSFVKKFDKDHIIVHHDSTLLRNIFYNLFSNAIKYSKKNSVIKLNITSSNENCIISISDNGIGIPKKDQKSLFQRFFRADNVSNIEGTGLGLSIVKEHVEIMGGQITFESKLNKGSRFNIQLPLQS